MCSVYGEHVLYMYVQKILSNMVNWIWCKHVILLTDHHEKEWQRWLVYTGCLNFRAFITQCTAFENYSTVHTRTFSCVFKRNLIANVKEWRSYVAGVLIVLGADSQAHHSVEDLILVVHCVDALFAVVEAHDRYRRLLQYVRLIAWRHEVSHVTIATMPSHDCGRGLRRSGSTRSHDCDHPSG